VLTDPDGFRTKSDAPSASASIVTFAPFVAIDESTTTGMSIPSLRRS